MRHRSATIALGLISVTWSCVGCAEPASKLAWRFRFAQPELAGRLWRVEAEVLRDGCAGEPAFSTQLNADGSGALSPGSLAPGTYGFRGRALDASCLWFAQGCRELKLPHSGTVEVVLDALETPTLDPRCTPPSVNGVNGVDEMGGFDATAPPFEASDAGDAGDARDAASPEPRAGALFEAEGKGETDGDLGKERHRDANTAPDRVEREVSDAAAPIEDAGSGSGSDASPKSFDPSASKCVGLDLSVVLCFDFEGSLSDLSGHGNDALGFGVGFEPGISGKALRVGGRRVAVDDDPTLNVAAFTIEFWLRSDSLANLSDRTDVRSVLLDKNAQYLLAYESSGALRAHLHRGGNNFELVTVSGAGNLTVDVWTYLVFAYDGAALHVYRDGVRLDSRVVNVALSRGVGAPLHIGSGSPDVSLGFDGLIDAVRISDVFRGDAWVCAQTGRQLLGGRCQ